jgi:hypothetical protein
MEAKKELTALTVTQQAMFLDLTIRQATRISTTFDQCGWHVPLCYPFSNRDLMNFCFTLPSAELEGQRIYRKWFEKESRSLVTRPTMSKYLPWLLYASVQRVLDQGARFSWKFRMPDNVNWTHRIEPIRPWLREICGQVDNSKFRHAFEAQLRPGTNVVGLLLIAGIALGLQANQSKSN